jgi:hypothetical protein
VLNAMTAVRLVATGAFLMLLGIPVLVQGLRKERLHQRGPHGRIERRRQPVRFWSSIAASGLVAFFGLIMLAWALVKTLA